MLTNTSSHTTYIRARICVPKQHEHVLYSILPSVGFESVTFVGFREVLYQTGISDEFVVLYNAFYRDSGLQMDTELSYDLPSGEVHEFVQFIELCTDGKVDWLVLAFAEVYGSKNFLKIEAIIAADPILQSCAFIERLP